MSHTDESLTTRDLASSNREPDALPADDPQTSPSAVADPTAGARGTAVSEPATDAAQPTGRPFDRDQLTDSPQTGSGVEEDPEREGDYARTEDLGARTDDRGVTDDGLARTEEGGARTDDGLARTEDGGAQAAVGDRDTPVADSRTSAGGGAPAAERDDEPTSAGASPDASPALLSPELSADFQGRWERVQTRFVDEPRGAVEEADSLVASVMQELAEGFAQERERLEAQWGRGEDISTEDLRVALQRYRSFFQRLLAA